MAGLHDLARMDAELRRAAVSVPEESTRPRETETSRLDPLDPDHATERYAHVVRRIARDHHIRKRTAERRFVEMLKFLDVCAEVKETVSPPARVDDAWHCFVLFTRDYAAYCQKRFGRFIHHEPMESKNPLAYKRAYEEATERFGELDRRVWRRPTDSWVPFFGACFGGGGGPMCGGGGCGGGGCGGGG
jgi:hypothetical protein